MISFNRSAERPEESLKPAIIQEQLDTRKKIEGVSPLTGLTVGTARFLAREGGFLVGGTINAGMTGMRSLLRGITGQSR